MSNYSYEAVDAGGARIQGSLEVTDQSEALKRIKEMGLFPTRIAQNIRRRRHETEANSLSRKKTFAFSIPFFRRRVKPRVLAAFTRQLATLIDAGMPLLRGLRLLREQEENLTLNHLLEELALSIESGSSLSEALSEHPRIFNRLYVNMVKAGELGGSLEITLRRLAEFLEKAQKIKGKVIAAMFYPVSVLLVATGIVGALMIFVVPRFRQVFDGLLNGAPLPLFTQVVFNLSQMITHHFFLATIGTVGLVVAIQFLIRTRAGRRQFDHFKLRMPVIGPVFRKAAIAHFARTLGTLLGNGVPMLQALTIVKEITGNVVVGTVVSSVHESVKEGGTIAAPLRGSRVFPALVAGMVDIGEQTGALPDMLLKVADGYDEEVDNSVNALTSLVEPIMIVFLAVIVGSIVIAMFLPMSVLIGGGLEPQDPHGNI